MTVASQSICLWGDAMRNMFFQTPLSASRPRDPSQVKGFRVCFRRRASRCCTSGLGFSLALVGCMQEAVDVRMSQRNHQPQLSDASSAYRNSCMVFFKLEVRARFRSQDNLPVYVGFHGCHGPEEVQLGTAAAAPPRASTLRRPCRACRGGRLCAMAWGFGFQ